MMRSILAAALVIGGAAQAADLKPETTPDGYSALVAAFPATATQVCIVREDSPGEPECRVRPQSPGTHAALWLRKLEPGEVVCAYSVNDAGKSPLSEDCWVGPAVEEKQP